MTMQIPALYGPDHIFSGFEGSYLQIVAILPDSPAAAIHEEEARFTVLSQQDGELHDCNAFGDPLTTLKEAQAFQRELKQLAINYNEAVRSGLAEQSGISAGRI